MLLEKLVEYAERVEELPPAMYQNVTIRWLVDLDARGDLLDFVSTTSGEERGNQRGKEFAAPHALATSGTTPKLLVGSVEYVFGIEATSSERAQRRHQSFVELIQDCAERTREPHVNAVLRFLKSLNSKTITLPGDYRPEHAFTFRVDGVLSIHLISVQRFWAERSQYGAATSQEKTKCLVCGNLCIPLERHPVQIKRVPGGQTSGMALISANEEAFESYGLSASLIAPVCVSCAQSYADAANALIRDDTSSIRIPPLVYIFWTKAESPFSPASIISQASPEDVKALLDSVRRGRDTATSIDANRFYATALSASGGRVVVRDWLDTAVGEAQRSLARYFALQSIVDEYGGEGSPLSIDAVADATVPLKNRKPDREKLNPNVPKALLRLALKREPLPVWLLFQAVKRNRAEQGVTRYRAALIKMVLLSRQSNLKEDCMLKLDAENQEPAYLCGRLLAVLEEIQRAAVPGAKATIIDRFFGTASSAPASVFGTLLRGAQAHLGKLRKEKRGHALERKLEEILSGLAAFPKILTLEQQGLFSLGYYHQRAASRAGAIAYKEAQRESDVETNKSEGNQ